MGNEREGEGEVLGGAEWAGKGEGEDGVGGIGSGNGTRSLRDGISVMRNEEMNEWMDVKFTHEAIRESFRFCAEYITFNLASLTLFGLKVVQRLTFRRVS